jgi:hypothetical protein
MKIRLVSRPDSALDVEIMGSGRSLYPVGVKGSMVTL